MIINKVFNPRKNHVYKIISIIFDDEQEIATTKFQGNAWLIAKQFDEVVYKNLEIKPVIEIR